jgi:hypothetical protein
MSNNPAARDLIAEHPDAQAFIQEVISTADGFRLFPNERFAKLIGNVLSGTSVDLQGESASIQGLEALVKAAASGEYWLWREHDPLIPPIGRVIAAKTFHAQQSNEHFVVGVVGFYDPASIPTFASMGINLSKFDSGSVHLPPPDKDELHAQLTFNPFEIPDSVVQQMLAVAPDFVDPNPVVSSRKGLSPLSVLEISASIWLLSSNPFVSKFQERLGEKAADLSVEFLKWIRETVVSKIRHIGKEDTRVVVSFLYGACRVEFVLKGDEGPVAISQAMQALDQAAKHSILLTDALAPFEPTRVVYGYDVQGKDWFPVHAVTRKQGVIADQPYLIALDNLQGGLSVGSTRLPLTEGNTQSKDSQS